MKLISELEIEEVSIGISKSRIPHHRHDVLVLIPRCCRHRVCKPKKEGLVKQTLTNLIDWEEGRRKRYLHYYVGVGIGICGFDQIQNLLNTWLFVHCLHALFSFAPFLLRQVCVFFSCTASAGPSNRWGRINYR